MNMNKGSSQEKLAPGKMAGPGHEPTWGEQDGLGEVLAVKT